MTEILMYCIAVVFGVFAGALFVTTAQLIKSQLEGK